MGNPLNPSYCRLVTVCVACNCNSCKYNINAFSKENPMEEEPLFEQKKEEPYNGILEYLKSCYTTASYMLWNKRISKEQGKNITEDLTSLARKYDVLDQLIEFAKEFNKKFEQQKESSTTIITAEDVHLFSKGLDGCKSVDDVLLLMEAL